MHVLSTPPAFVLSQDQTLYKMVSKELSSFKSFIESFIMTSFVLRLPFRVIDLTAYSGDLWYSFKSCSVWCFLFVTLFNLQGTRPSGRNIAILSGSVSFVKHFFHLFQDFFFSPRHPPLLRDSFHRIPDHPPIVNTLFYGLSIFFVFHIFHRFFNVPANKSYDRH